ncbi:MAG: helix-turn-helix transcriptional regulator [Thalassovita sp.]
MRKQRHEIDDTDACPMEATLDLIGGKWKGVILFRLGEGTKRFNELDRLLCRITPRTLTKQLRELEHDGLVKRTVYAQVPPKVEYDLTEKGETLMPILTSLTKWGEEHALPERNDSAA